MNYEKSAKRLREMLEDVEAKLSGLPPLLRDRSSLNSDVQALTFAIAAVEGNIPQKPLPDPKWYGNGKCPRCGAVFMDKSTGFCGNCGQALNWEE